MEKWVCKVQEFLMGHPGESETVIREGVGFVASGEDGGIRFQESTRFSQMLLDNFPHRDGGFGITVRLFFPHD